MDDIILGPNVTIIVNSRHHDVAALTQCTMRTEAKWYAANQNTLQLSPQ